MPEREEWMDVDDYLVPAVPFMYRMDWFNSIQHVNACLLASYIKGLEHRRRNFWVPLSRDNIQTATGLSREQIETARKKLRDLDLLEERNDRLNHQMYYRLIGSIGAKIAL